MNDPTKPYDGNTTATLTSSNFALTGLFNGDSFTVTKTTGTYDSKDTNAATVTASLASTDFTPASGSYAGDYALPTTASGQGTITPQTLTASIIGATTKPYDSTLTATLTPANFSISGLIDSEGFTVTQTSGTYNSKDVLTATTVTASLASGDFIPTGSTLASDYTLPTTASGPATVSRATPTVSVTNPGGVYNGSAFPATAATVTGVGSDAEPIASFGNPLLSYTYYQGATPLGTDAPSGIGDYTVVAHYAGGGNYKSADSAAVPFSITNAVWVNDNWVNVTNPSGPLASGDTVAAPSGETVPNAPAALVYGANAFSSIQAGVTNANTGGTVYVLPGTYVENVTINKALTLAGAGQSGAGATTILPSFAGAVGGSTFANGASNLILVQASNVTIEDLLLDGNNPSLAGQSGATTVNGVNVDAQNGIVTDYRVGTPFSNFVVHDTTVQNIDFRGIYDSDGGTFDIYNNTVTNDEGDPSSVAIFNFGGSGIFDNNTVSYASDAISANWSAGTQFIGNTISHSGSGIHTDNTQAQDLIENNAITQGTAGSYGIWVFVPYENVTVSNNQVTDSDIGLGAFAGGGGVVTFTGNTVNFTAPHAGSFGAYVSTTTWYSGEMPVSAVFSGTNAISNADYGLYIAQNPTPVTATTTVSISGLALNNNTTGIEINGGTVTFGSGNSITGGITGLVIDNQTTFSDPYSPNTPTTEATTSTIAGDTLGNLVFTDQSGNYITLADGALGGATPTTLDASGATFDGTAAAALVASDTSAYAVEGKITDYLDNSSLGYVSLQPTTVYVAHSSETASAGAVQRGINVAPSAGTVNVQAGVYVANSATNPGGLDIESPLTLRRAQAGIDPTQSLPATSGQTIIEPGASDPNPFDSSSIVLVYVGSSNVNIDGVTVDGDNPALASDSHTVSFNGAAIDAAYGIAAWSGSSNLTLTNNIVRNTTYSGVDLENYGLSATSDNTVSHNLIQNLGGGGYGYGIGVLLSWNLYADVVDNKIDDVRIGVQTGNYYLANPGVPATASISNNQISAYRLGVFYNVSYSSASPFTVDDNDITAATDPNPHSASRWTGIMISTQQGSVTASFDGNTIDGSAAAGFASTAGYTVWSDPTTGTLLVSGGSVAGVQYGVWVNSYEGYASAGDATSVTVSGVDITASQIGVYVEDSPANSSHPAVSATIEGNTSITTGGGGTGILVSGSHASATISGNDGSIYGNVIGIDLEGGSATVSGNHIYDNTTGIKLGAGTATISSNNFAGATDNTTDLLVAGGTLTALTGNTFAGTTYINNQTSQAIDATGDTFGSTAASASAPATVPPTPSRTRSPTTSIIPAWATSACS